MLIVIILYALISFTCLWTGFISYNLLATNKDITAERHWVMYALSGLIVVTFLAQVVELFLPLNQSAWLVLMVILSLISLFQREVFLRFLRWIAGIKSLSRLFIVIVTAHILFLAVYNAGPTLMDDTESYHIQMIKWIQEYGTPPGLANLHERYGFNSSWFALVSFFIPSKAENNFYTIPNGLLSVWLALYLLQNTWQLITMRDNWSGTIAMASFIVFLAALYCWPMIRGNTTTVNYDFISAFVVLVLFTEIIKSQEKWKRYLPELFIWPVFLFTIRIINYPLLLITLFAFVNVYRERRFAGLTKGLVLSAGLLLPFLVRNVLLSGYLFYPVSQIDLFNVDWKADQQLAIEIVEYIKYFNRVNAKFMPTHEIAKLTTPDWIPVWFHYLFAYDKPILFLGVSGYLLSAIRWSRTKNFSPPVKIILLVCFLQLISWFIVAPDPRFVYGPLFAGILIIPFLLLPVQVNKKMLHGALMVLTCFIFLYGGNNYLRDKKYNNPLMPVIVPSPPLSERVQIDHIVFNIPGKLPGNWNPRCYATALPCLYTIQSGLKPRGKRISDGFKIEK